jgi:hypothetical protein
MKFLAIMLLSVAATTSTEPPLGLASSLRSLDEQDRAAITRCSHAALFMVWATEKFPDSRDERGKHFGGLINSSDLRAKFGDQMPSQPEGIFALLAGERYLTGNSTPSTVYEYQRFAAEISGACSLQTRHRPGT